MSIPPSRKSRRSQGAEEEATNHQHQHQHQEEEEEEEEEGFIAATYNVNWGCCIDTERSGTAQAQSVLAALLSGRPHLACLVETTPEWDDFFSRQDDLREIYPYQAFHMTEGWFAGGMTVLSQIPFKEIGWIDAPSGWFPGWALHFPSVPWLNGSPLRVLSVHLRPPLSPSTRMPFGVSPAAWYYSKGDRKNDIERFLSVMNAAEITEDGDDEERSRKSRNSKKSKGKEEEGSSSTCGADIPVLVMGDFNEEEGGQAYRFLEEQGLRDARKEFDGAKHTWQWPLLGGWYTMRARYDHLFYSPRTLKCLGAQVIQEGASDHFPVVARFLVRSEGDLENTQPASNGCIVS